jgi:glutaminyl-peptide cyclotransferase
MQPSLPSRSRARWRSATVWILVTLATVGVAIVGLSTADQRKRGRETDVAEVRVVAEFPHDATAFTQGLAVVAGQMYEGTGKLGESSLRRVDLATGKVEAIVPLDKSLFGEGITVMDGRIYQLTWQNRLGLVFDQKTLNVVSRFRYTGEGWGLTNDGKHLIVSDGTATLRFLNPRTFEVAKRLKVHAANGPVDKLNELEFVKGEILANVWYSDRIVRISPENGAVLGWVDLASLYPADQRSSKEDVLNGIAYDEKNGRLFVTGKNWPKLYEIEIKSKR